MTFNECFDQENDYKNKIILLPTTLPPDNAFLFNPKREDIFSRKKIRYIYFGGQKFSEHEETSINSLIALFYQKKCSLINECLPPLCEECKLRGILLKYLYEYEFNLEKVFNEIMLYIKWKKINIPFQINNDSFEIISEGNIFSYGRDICFRPIIYFKFENSEEFTTYLRKKYVEQGTLFICSYIQNYMLLDGQIENCIAIIDLNLSNLELSLVDFFHQIFDKTNYCYKAFFFKIIVLNAKNLNTFCTKHILKSMNRIYVNEIEFCPEINTTKLLQYISKNQLLAQYGGIAEIKNYWPPDVPNSNFEEKVTKILKIEEYVKKLQDNEFMIPRPDLASTIRKNRKNKKGIIPHKEIMFEKYIERRNSYNEIAEKIQKIEKIEKIGKNIEEIKSEFGDQKNNSISSSNQSEILYENNPPLNEVPDYSQMGEILNTKHQKENESKINNDNEEDKNVFNLENNVKNSSQFQKEHLNNYDINSKVSKIINKNFFIKGKNISKQNSIPLTGANSSSEDFNSIKPELMEGFNKSTCINNIIIEKDKNDLDQEHIKKFNSFNISIDKNQVIRPIENVANKDQLLINPNIDSKDFLEEIKEKSNEDVISTPQNDNNMYNLPNQRSEIETPTFIQLNLFKKHGISECELNTDSKVKNYEFEEKNYDLRDMSLSNNGKNIQAQIQMKSEVIVDQNNLITENRSLNPQLLKNKNEKQSESLPVLTIKEVTKSNNKWYLFGDCC